MAATRGMEDFFTMLRFLDNRREFDVYIDQLRKETEKNLESVKAITKAKDIGKALAKASKDRQQASDDLIKADKAAVEIVEQATTKARDLMKSADERAMAMKLDLDTRQQELDALLADQKSMQTTIDKQEKAADRREREALHSLAQAKSAQKEYESKRDTLRGAINQVH